ncbi:hypothetical protein [Methylocystis parvus]|uniref:Membrane-associated protein n=1 Tax=Methylocystis parvus TaxID=134 RepID=A0A6B8M1T8_9HYPH|nr:hypothetical protein [Methylocystis parvus]QGM96308.1 hypothetical protein F7D14_01615 [Methylocystis parvus]WBJ99853.1 hypothetical protein MMG94_18010 [Methylocystis parvus OBBP]
MAFRKFWRQAVSRSVPLPLKLGFTVFMAVLIPVYWTNYGPTNFLYFCDMALLLTLAGVWLESPLLVSMPTVGILAPQILWVADFGFNLGGVRLTGMTDYMFEAATPLLLRGLSLFHGWLPFLLVYLVWRLGYDRRALLSWTALAWGLMLVSYFFLPGPRPDAGLTPVNVDYVFGPSDKAPQTWMPDWAWLTLMMVGLPVALFSPVHLAMNRWRGASA